MSYAVFFDVLAIVIGLYGLVFRRRTIERAWKGFGGERDSPAVMLGVIVAAAVLLSYGVISLVREVL